MSEKQTEALRLAGEYRKTMPSDVLHLWADDVVGELRRLHVALLEAEAGLIMAGADVEPASDFVPSPTAALRIVRAALLPSNAEITGALMGRKFTGIERESKYFDVACERINSSNG